MNQWSYIQQIRLMKEQTQQCINVYMYVCLWNFLYVMSVSFSWTSCRVITDSGRPLAFGLVYRLSLIYVFLICFVFIYVQSQPIFNAIESYPAFRNRGKRKCASGYEARGFVEAQRNAMHRPEEDVELQATLTAGSAMAEWSPGELVLHARFAFGRINVSEWNN